MQTSPLADTARLQPVPGASEGASAVSWAAILAGAFGAAAFSLILLMLGTGLGLSSLSPWSSRGTGAAVFGVAAIVWVAVTQILASGLGGYLAGRLRTKWASVQADEVFFRDTAHGFLAWAVSTLVTASLVATAIGSVVGAAAEVTGSAASAAVAGVGAGAAAEATKANVTSSPLNPVDYYIDAMFRASATPAPGASNAASAPAMGAASSGNTPANAEATRIVLNSVRSGALPPADAQYLGQLVAQRTGMGQAEAEKRVTDVYAQAQARLREMEDAAKQAADKARKAAIHVSLWLFISLLIGAFTASLAATYGGRERDR